MPTSLASSSPTPSTSFLSTTSFGIATSVTSARPVGKFERQFNSVDGSAHMRFGHSSFE